MAWPGRRRTRTSAAASGGSPSTGGGWGMGRNNRSGGGRNNNDSKEPVRVVGTEAKALKNLERNRTNFKYPPEGFEIKIEHSLLYAMLSEPTLYPEKVIKEELTSEDFEQYLVIDDPRRREEEPPRTSYAQLSALLSLAAEKSPSKEPAEEGMYESTGTITSTTTTQQQQQSNQSEPSIPETLCKSLLRTVIRHAEKHDLDRQTEVQELLSPVERLSEVRGEKAALGQVLPFYIGYAAALATGNPLPMLLGFAATNAMPDANREERVNVRGMSNETRRRGDVETTGLLDEAEGDDW